MNQSLTFFTALMRCEAKDIVLIGNDKVKAIKFPYTKLSSPSLLPLMSETVKKKDRIYCQTITFDRLTGEEIVSKIKSYA